MGDKKAKILRLNNSSMQKKNPKLPNSNMLINPKMQTRPVGYLNSNKA